MSPTSKNVILRASSFVGVPSRPFLTVFPSSRACRSSCATKINYISSIFPRTGLTKWQKLAWKLGSNWLENLFPVANAIGDPCEADVQCRVTFAPYSECRQNICQCSDGSHYMEGRCYESVGECTLLPLRFLNLIGKASPAIIISPPSWKRFIESGKMYLLYVISFNILSENLTENLMRLLH